jgi:hypothetical protein
MRKTALTVTDRKDSVHASLLFRHVNNRIAEVGDAWNDGEPSELLCECGDESCTETIPVDRADYDEALKNGELMLVTYDHASRSDLRIVTARDRYCVVADPRLARERA